MEQVTGAGIITFKLTDEYTEILLLNDGKFWGFPKGKIKEGESLQETAMREFHEETNMDLQLISLEPLYISTYEYKKENRDIEKTVHFFGGIVEYESQVTLSDEHIEYDWVHWREAYKLLKFESLREALKSAMEWKDSHKHAVEKLARDLDDLA